jgi:hypothetical protein
VKKLKLEDLTVTSFDTAPDGPQARGTVDAHARTQNFTCTCNEPTNPDRDCTLGCSINTDCPDTCQLM